MLIHYYYTLILFLAIWATTWSNPIVPARPTLAEGLRWPAIVIYFTTFVAFSFLKRLFRVR